jgi:putative heme-binding domain-containing protein
MRKVQPEGDLTAIAGLINDEHEALRVAAIEAAGLWHVETARETLLAIASDQAVSDTVRRAALDGLAAYGAQSAGALSALCGKSQPLKIRSQAIAALAALDAQAAAAALVQLLTDDPAADPAVVVPAILDRNGGAAALISAVSGQKLAPDTAKLAVRAVRSAAREEPELVAAISKAGGITAPKRTLTPSELQAFLADVSGQGDASRGEAIFRRGAQSCLKCHAIAGAGGRVGPDLVSIGASAQPDYLVESILEPSAKIKENYHSLTVVSDGIITSGVKVRETDSELVLRDADDREIVIPLDAIEAKKEGGSIMPVGLADELTRGELVDLVRFLSELGKVGPFAVGKAPVARRWEATTAAAFDPATDKESWASVYSTVSGDLPLSSLPSGESKQRVVRCQVEAAVGGKVDALVGGPAAKLWLDGKPVELADKTSLDLSAGVHTLTLLLHDEPQAKLRLELAAAPGSAAQVQFVGGK